MSKESFGKIGRNILRGTVIGAGLLVGGEKSLEAEDISKSLNSADNIEYKDDDSKKILTDENSDVTFHYGSAIPDERVENEKKAEEIKSQKLLGPDNLNSHDTVPDKMYETKDGNLRYYHNPSENSLQKGDVEYMVCATVCHFNNLKQIELETKVPENLTETDFFTNYLNTKIKPGTVLFDKNTGNQYFDYSADTTINSVPFEGEKHWNIQRFLIQPHFNNFDISKDKARQNVLYDMYKYFLYIENGNRSTAWIKANQFLEKEVDPIINSEYFKWAKENYQKLHWRPGMGDYRYKNSDHVLYKIEKDELDNVSETTDLVDRILAYNNSVFNREIKGEPYSREEIENILIDYNINYRKKDIEEAKKIAKNSVASALNRYRQKEEFYKNKPLTEYKVIKETQYPVGFNTWSPDEQYFWLNDAKNKNLIGETKEAFTEKDREYELNLTKNYRFSD